MDYEIFLSKIEKTGDLVHKKLSQILSGDMEPQLTLPYLKVLSVISKSDIRTMSDIANEMAVSLSAITAIVDRLVELELVNRVRSKKDRRIVEITINEKGREVLLHKEKVIRNILDKCFASFSQEEMEICIMAMDKIAQNLNQE